jgi:hypothetical protein
MGRFLGWCRFGAARGEDVVVLAKGYLAELEAEEGMPAWRWEQAREALRLLLRGTESWRWEEEGGEAKLRFRVRGRVVGVVEEPGCGGEALDGGDGVWVGGGRPRSWRPAAGGGG